MVDNISHWASDEIKVIHVSEGYTRTPVELRVRQFCPQEGDKLTRSWVANGSKKSVDIPLTRSNGWIGANILLAYFHYCNKGIYPFSNDCKEQDLRTLAELDESAIRFVKETRSFASDHKRQWQRLHQEGLFEDDYFFLSQLFTENWEPRSTV
ncbi:unnamed protein product [Parascedosporium putredinis]|uniref:Uncharacterized protein n=1 Tax=Parascedosporium putredinis TaxID=1442378 RepID=A0A9P1H5H9_9PEZI|nr:unnamed protein product [Parascedosporium putredinis]CAI7997954.1 unnamed protein product [Parascedosporium putredinis]